MLRPFFLSIQWILVFLIFNPFFLLILPTGLDSYDLQRIAELLLLASVTAHLLIDSEFRAHSLQFLENVRAYKRVLLFGFFGLGVLSALHAEFPRYALMQVGTFFSLMLFMTSIAGWISLQKEVFFKNFSFFILFTATVNAITALGALVYVEAHPAMLSPSIMSPDTLINVLATPGFINRRFFDDVQVFLIPLLMMLFFLRSGSKWKQIAIFFLIAFCFARGFLDGSRLYFVEPILLLIILPLFFRRHALPFLTLLLATFIAGAILYFGLYQWNLNFGTETLHASLSAMPSRTLLNHRGELWMIALELIKAHPFLGAGPLHFGFYAFLIENAAAHPHSAVLMLAAEWGLPAFILLLVLVITALYCFCQKIRVPAESQESLYFRMGLCAALIGGFTMMQVDGLTLMPPGQVMLMLVSGLALFVGYGPQNPEILCLNSKRFTWGMMLLSIIALVFIVWGIFPYVMNPPAHVLSYLMSCSFNCRLSPDYWSQGFIQFY